MHSRDRCPNHPDEQPVYECQSCSRRFCAKCQEGIKLGSPQCPDCFSLETTVLFDAAEWTDWPDLL